MYTHIAYEVVQKPVVVLIYTTLYLIIRGFIKRNFALQIINSQDIDISNNIRKKYRKIRWYINLLNFTIIMWYSITLMIYITNFPMEISFMLCFSCYCLCAIFSIFRLPIYDNSFVIQGEYCLFLRGFVADDYKRYYIHFLKLKRFSELEFFYIVDKFLPSYATAKPGTLTSPYGAYRFYTNDDNWRRKILDHMKNSKLIIFHIDDSPSCIWELEQLSAYSEKLIVICSNHKKLTKIHLDKFPFLENCKIDNVIFYDFKDGTNCKQIAFRNSLVGYKKVVKTVFVEMNIFPKKKKSYDVIIMYIIIYVIWLFPVLMAFNMAVIPIWLPFVIPFLTTFILILYSSMKQNQHIY